MITYIFLMIKIGFMIFDIWHAGSFYSIKKLLKDIYNTYLRDLLLSTLIFKIYKVLLD